MVFSCEPCEIFKSIYFVEHRRTAASAIDTDAKYSINSSEKQVISYNGDELLEMGEVMGLANAGGR